MSESKASWAQDLCTVAEPILLNAEGQAEKALANQKNTPHVALEPGHGSARLAAAARSELARQAVRKQFLPAGMTHDAGWAILLDVFVSEFGGKPIQVSDSADRWNLGPETAVRQIAGLIATNLIKREPNLELQGAAYLGLTPHGLGLLQRTLEIID